MTTAKNSFMALAALVLGGGVLVADQVEMQNGDRYVGKVVSLSGETLVVQTESLGTVRLSRGKVARISLDAGSPLAGAAGTNEPAVGVAGGRTNGVPQGNGVVGAGNVSSNLVAKVQKQFLAGAGPEAQAKFNELLSGFLSGKLNVEDIRAEAQTAAEQLRAHRKDLGDENGFLLDGYLAILDRFLKETATGTNRPAKLKQPDAGQKLEDE